MTRTLPALIGLVTALVAAGCGGDDDTDATSTAPDISALSFDPSSVPSGRATIVTGRLTFTDPDGDVDHLMAALALGETRQEVGPIEVQGVDGIEAGEVNFLLQLQPPSAMPLTVEVWLVDQTGEASNRLSGQIEVTAP